MVHRAVLEGMEPQVFLQQSPEVVFDYFASEVFEKLDAAIRDFLHRTSFLPVMSAAMAGELTGNAHAGRILSEMARHNYFVERKVHGDAVYAFHPLFRHFLQERARALLTGEELIKLMSDAAVLLEREGRVDEVLDLMHLAGLGDHDPVHHAARQGHAGAGQAQDPGEPAHKDARRRPPCQPLASVLAGHEQAPL